MPNFTLLLLFLCKIKLDIADEVAAVFSQESPGKCREMLCKLVENSQIRDQRLNWAVDALQKFDRIPLNLLEVSFLCYLHNVIMW